MQRILDEGATDCDGPSLVSTIVSSKVYWKSGKQTLGVFRFRYCKTKQVDLWNYPITGISFAQANTYINWRNSIIRAVGQKWSCRFPSLAEWEKIAELSYEHAVKVYAGNAQEYENIYKKTGRNSKGCLLINILNENPCENDKKYAAQDARDGIFPTTSFFPNVYGIFTLQGNVSEMTSVKGVAAGGNYSLPMDQAHFDSKQNYSKPEIWLGFRCVAQKD